MAEENKEVKKEEVKIPAAETAAQKVPEAPAQAPAQAAQPAAASAQPAAVVKKERPANCAACNKSIKNKRWYYRDGKYYCTKRCWKTTLKKEDAKAATPAQ